MNQEILKKAKYIQGLLRQSTTLTAIFSTQLAFLGQLQNLLGDTPELTEKEKDDLLDYIRRDFRDWATDAAAAATELQVHFNSATEPNGDLITLPVFTTLIGLIPDIGGLETYVSIGVKFVNYLHKTLGTDKPVSLSDFFSTWQNFFSNLIVRQEEEARNILNEVLNYYNYSSYSDLKAQVRVGLQNSQKTKKQLQQEIMTAWVKQSAENHSDNIFESAIEKGAGYIIMEIKGQSGHTILANHPKHTYNEQKQNIINKQFGNPVFKNVKTFLDDVQRPKGTINAIKHCYNEFVSEDGSIDMGKLQYLPAEAMPFDIRLKLSAQCHLAGTGPPSTGNFHVQDTAPLGNVRMDREKGKWKYISGDKALFDVWQKSSTGHPTVKDLSIDDYL